MGAGRGAHKRLGPSAAAMGPSTFVGNDLTAWCTHFGLPVSLQEALENEGVDDVSDLVHIYFDPDYMSQFAQMLSPKVFDVFKAAQRNTQGLSDLSSPSDEPPAPPISISLPMSTLPPRASLQQQSDQIRLERAQAWEQEMIEEKKRKIKEHLLKVKKESAIDLLFVMDLTGSMQKIMTRTKERVLELVMRIKGLHASIVVRIGLVGYRDHGDEDRRLVVLHLTENVEAFREKLGAEEADGGGDDAEDVLGALDMAAKINNWAAPTRILYHIGDAPCHGTEFHGPGVADNFPSGEPHALQAATVLQALRDKDIRYFFAKINSSTDIMINKFNKILGALQPPSSVTVTQVDELNFVDVMAHTVIADCTTSLSRTERLTEETEFTVPLSVDVPVWEAMPPERCSVYPIAPPTDLAELVAQSTDQCVTNFPMPNNAVVFKLAPQPFARGGQRAAVFGRKLGLDGAGETDVVFKRILSPKQRDRTKRSYEAQLVCHRAAAFLALQFNKDRPQDCPSIRYCDASIVQLNERWREQQPHVICEEAVSGTFEKFNGNAGYCASCPTLGHGTDHTAVQAFSHYTHYVSGGALLVVDCQGGYDHARNEFVLTDPVIHCPTILQYGLTNFGEEGAQLFFATHRCNDICRALQLPPPAPAE